MSTNNAVRATRARLLDEDPAVTEVAVRNLGAWARPEVSRVASGVVHGRPSSYTVYGCRCDPCRAASTNYQRLRRARIREERRAEYERTGEVPPKGPLRSRRRTTPEELAAQARAREERAARLAGNPVVGVEPSWTRARWR